MFFVVVTSSSAIIVRAVALGSQSSVTDDSGKQPYRSLGEISVKDPAFVRARDSPPSLWITHFSALTAGEVLTAISPHLIRISPLQKPSSFPQISSGQTTSP